MAISDNLSSVWVTKEQAEDLFEARAVMENATSVANEALTRFKEIKTSGSFGTVPQDVINAMLDWEEMFDDLKAAFMANPSVLAVYNWRP